MDELSSLVASLKLRNSKDDTISSLQKILDSVLERDDYDRESIGQHLIENGLLSELNHAADESDDEARLAAQIIAELAKTALVRDECVKAKLVEQFVNHIVSEDSSKSIQVCRALGNICYDHDAGRKAVEHCRALDKLVELMMRIDNDVISADQQKLRLMVCGCILNITNTNDRLQKEAVSQGVFDLLKSYLKKYCTNNDDLVSMILLTIGSLVDSESGRHYIVNTGLIESVIDLYQNNTVADIEESILELLSTIAESDEVKTLLCNTPLPSHLIASVRRRENSTDEENLSVLRAAADLLILLLIGNESMETLYHNGDGSVYQECVSWMSSPNEYMCMSGALAVGNYARGDTHSIHLVETGITSKLLSVLQRQNDNDPSLIVVHAALSALRNLAIPAPNKKAMIESDVVSQALRFSKCDLMPIQFKLLGLLRMLIDGEASTAENLGMRVDFIRHVIKSCSEENHAGVKGEAIRLLAWLVKNSKSAAVMSTIIQEGGLPHLVGMITSDHVVMQNEALIALVLIATVVLDNHATALKNSELIATLALFLSGENLDQKITANAIALVEALVKCDDIKTSIASSGMRNALTKLKGSEKSDETVKIKASEMISILDQGTRTQDKQL